MNVRLGMIWAEARGADGRGAIGRDGEMPWHLPEDLAHLKRVTMGTPVIMGRRTWESLPERFRPLPGRDNAVVSRAVGYEAVGATVAPSLESALAALTDSADAGAASNDPSQEVVWIMGGGQLYREAMPLADELVVTRIALDVPDADTFAPEIGPEWALVDPGEPRVSTTGLGYRFERWRRRP